MRTNIAVKLFLGFLIVILLNVFYVFVVSKLSELNIITGIVKRQNEIRNTMLRISALHGDRVRSRASYEAIRETGPINNFKRLGENISELVDSVILKLHTVIELDSLVSRKQKRIINSEILKAVLDVVTDKIKKYNDAYMAYFDDLIRLDAGRGGTLSRRRRKKIIAVQAAAGDRLLSELKRIDLVIDEQTRLYIKDIENRIRRAREITIMILIGILIISLMFAFFFSRAITTALRRLKDSTSYVAKGNFEFNPQGYPNDEIGDLASAFFDMLVDLKNAQEELVKSKRLAAIGQVVASVNHEINNPLMIISGNAQFLEMCMKDYPVEMQERIRAILEETERISQVTKKLREIRNPVVEDYTSTGEQMINLDKSSLDIET